MLRASSIRNCTIPPGQDLLCGFNELPQRADIAVQAVKGLDGYDDTPFLHQWGRVVENANGIRDIRCAEGGTKIEELDF